MGVTKMREADKNPTEKTDNLSPEMEELLNQEAREAEIQAAIDAAYEEGLIISREEAIQILQRSSQPQEEDLS